jgi:predicted HD phosphohydrolase
MEKIKNITQLFLEYGDITYGEKMTVLSHSVQAALLAKEKNLGDKMIVAAFLHDLGHMLPLTDYKTQDMDGFGSIDHESSGADYLKDLGFEDMITVPIRNHVLSKRYLCTAHPAYYDTLSDASKKTMEFQGGLLSSEEVLDFENQTYFQESLDLRYLDDEAKDEDFVVDPTVYEELVASVKKILDAPSN